MIGKPDITWVLSAMQLDVLKLEAKADDLRAELASSKLASSEVDTSLIESLQKKVKVLEWAVNKEKSRMTAISQNQAYFLSVLENEKRELEASQMAKAVLADRLHKAAMIMELLNMDIELVDQLTDADSAKLRQWVSEGKRAVRMENINPIITAIKTAVELDSFDRQMESMGL